jgi:phospholipid/cholesterol/gamma-HCH transport system substrate-binding protein
MYSKVNYTLIGIFVMLFAAGVVLFAFWLGSSGFRDDYDFYRLRMEESVSGLSRDSGVKLKGVDIGTVSDIRIDPDNIEAIDLTLRIKHGTPIKEDMRGVIKMYGVTGLSYIELEGGSNQAKTLDPDQDPIPEIMAGPSLIFTLSDNLETIMSKLVVMLSDENIQKFERIFDNIEIITQKAPAIEDELILALQDARSALAEFEKLSGSYDRLAVDLHAEVMPAIDDFSRLSGSIESLVMEIRKTVNRGDYNMQKIMQPTINDVRELAEQFESLSRQLKQSPTDFLFKSSTPLRGPGE